MKKMKVFCYSSNVALATFSQRLLAEKPQMVDLDKRDCHSIYIRTVSSEHLSSTLLIQFKPVYEAWALDRATCTVHSISAGDQPGKI